MNTTHALLMKDGRMPLSLPTIIFETHLQMVLQHKMGLESTTFGGFSHFRTKARIMQFTTLNKDLDIKNIE